MRCLCRRGCAVQARWGAGAGGAAHRLRSRWRGGVCACEPPQPGSAVVGGGCDKDERRAGGADRLRGCEAADPVVVAAEGALLLEGTARRPHEDTHRGVDAAEEQQLPARGVAGGCVDAAWLWGPDRSTGTNSSVARSIA